MYFTWKIFCPRATEVAAAGWLWGPPAGAAGPGASCAPAGVGRNTPNRKARIRSRQRTSVILLSASATAMALVAINAVVYVTTDARVVEIGGVVVPVANGALELRIVA